MRYVVKGVFGVVLLIDCILLIGKAEADIISPGPLPTYTLRGSLAAFTPGPSPNSGRGGQGARAATLTLPYTPSAWVPDGADARWLAPAETGGLEANAHYIRTPRREQSYDEWRAAIQKLRQESRDNRPPSGVRVDFRGVRAWTRMQGETGRRLALGPGEQISVSLEARWISGNPEVCFALDFMSLQTNQWVGWSSVFAAMAIPQDGRWHILKTDLTLPAFDSNTSWVNLIIGQDATYNPSPGVWEMRDMSVHMENSPSRQQAVERLKAAVEKASRGLDRSIYDRRSLSWSVRNFACYFAFIYDSSFYDPKMMSYRVDVFLDEMKKEFGGVDSIVLWHAYPRIGVDRRSQFDFYRDMPGGLKGVKQVVGRFHRRGVKVFIDYNPWDTGTRREGVPDEVALGRLLRAIGVDGIFLDTMSAAPVSLRPTIDAHRKGVIFEPEGSPAVDQLSFCNASWAQWLASYPEPGILRLKWIEPRHMQHQIRRWDRSHAEEIETAFFNGSGMLIWENIFGSFNPWNPEDRTTWKQASPILRAFAQELASESWQPCIPALTEGLYINRWKGNHADLYLILNRTGEIISAPIFRLTAISCRERAFDLWRRKELHIGQDGLIQTELGRLGAIAVAWDEAGIRQAEAAMKGEISSPDKNDPRMKALPHDPKPVSKTPPGDPANPPEGMVLIPRSDIRMAIRHERRECGCYPDPVTPAERQAHYTYGSAPFDTLVHDYIAQVGPFLIDECPVTNGQYEAFLKTTGYRPKEPRNFLKHWPGGKCPESLKDHPVVYVDLEDARAYARWAGKRLPTEEEWQLAAQGTDGRKWPWGNDFDPTRCNGKGESTAPVKTFPGGRSPFECYDMTGNVWQWTESERDDGHTRYAIIRGGSFFDAEGSGWYVHGGAQPLDHHAKFILMYPGLDRCATIGFRCVQDVR